MGQLITVSVIAFWFTAVQADQTSRLDLEPCINGGVSASGTYPTQVAEDLANTYREESELADLQVHLSGWVPRPGAATRACGGDTRRGLPNSSWSFLAILHRNG